MKSSNFTENFFKTLVGGTYEFYGIDFHSFCIGHNGARIVLEAREDPDDGYRSYFDCFQVKNVDKIFFKESIAKVKLISLDESKFIGWQLLDAEDSHAWLTVGTSYIDDYYPCFVFDYQPKK